MNEQFKSQLKDISRRINDIECSVWGIYRDTRVMENNEELNDDEKFSLIHTWTVCAHLLKELSEY